MGAVSGERKFSAEGCLMDLQKGKREAKGSSDSRDQGRYFSRQVENTAIIGNGWEDTERRGQYGAPGPGS